MMDKIELKKAIKIVNQREYRLVKGGYKDAQNRVSLKDHPSYILQRLNNAVTIPIIRRRAVELGLDKSATPADVRDFRNKIREFYGELKNNGIGSNKFINITSDELVQFALSIETLDISDVAEWIANNQDKIDTLSSDLNEIADLINQH